MVINKNQKLNLIYDATTLTRFFEKNNSRAGIFFVAYNILKELDQQQNCNITLFLNNGRRKFIRLLKYDTFFSKFKYFSFDDKREFYGYINKRREQIRNERNILPKLICYLKIFINYLRVLRSKILCRHNNNKYKYFSKDADIFFSPSQPHAPELKTYRHIKYFIFLHDVIPYIFYKDALNLDSHWFNKITNSLNKDTYYFCNSECTRNDFLKYYGPKLDNNKMTVTYIATAQMFYPCYDREKLSVVFDKYKAQYNDNGKYIFSLCTLDPRKNLLFTTQCFIKFIIKHNIKDLFFYIGGPLWNTFLSKLKEHIANFDEYSDRIVGLGYIDDQDINILYSNSLFFTYISQYEGFGMPPLEAMQAGTPVITSNNSSLPEVVGDAAIMIDYNSEEQCIKAFEDFYFNDSLRKHYIKKGLARAKHFTWEKTVNIMTEKMLESIQA